MEETKADAAVPESRLRPPAKRARDHAVPGADDVSVPAEAEVAGLVKRGDRDVELASSDIYLESLDLRGDSAPGLVAHGDEQTADDLAVAEADTAKVDPFKFCRQRAGTQHLARQWCFVAAGEQDISSVFVQSR